MWRLKATKPVPNVKIFGAYEVWGDEGLGVSGLAPQRATAAPSGSPSFSRPTDEQTVLDLSAIALFEPRINAVSGVLVDDKRKVNWSGGFFLPHGRVFDPYNGRPFPRGAIMASSGASGVSMLLRR